MKLETLIPERARAFAASLTAAASTATKEEEIRIASERELRVIQDSAGIRLEGKHEFTVASGFVDSVYDRVLIEYKNPSSPGARLGPTLDSPGTKKVVEQIKSRFSDMRVEQGQPINTLFGVGLDGRYFVFVRFRDNDWQIQEPVPVNSDSAERFLWALFNLGTKGKPFSPTELARDFGADAPSAQRAVRGLYETLLQADHPKTLILFSQWRILFGEVCGYDVDTTSERISRLAVSYGIDQSDVKAAQLLFALHTYYALFMKLLASQIVAFVHQLPTPLSKMIRAGGGIRLKREVEDLEAGSIFRHFNITNFMEGDLFAWYLPVWNVATEEWVKTLVSQLDEYNPGTLSEDPAESRDLLKKLYHQLFPKSVRHDLGEYYTPDWLAELVLQEVGFSGDADLRILDPACGSGTFLVMAIARIRQWYSKNREMIPYDEGQLCERILKNVIGFELNPLAVMAARTNYLIAIRDLISQVASVELPIYLCDSIMTPSEHDGLFAGGLQKARQFKTAGATFIIPSEIAGNQTILASYAELLERGVENKYSPKEFVSMALEADLPVTDHLLHENLFGELLRLDHEQKNGVWARIIKNAFAPLFTAQVDFVVGNPPWINWESLPEAYRQTTAPLWLEYGLFSQKGYKAKLGGAKDDISVLMTYVCHDNYLKVSGKLGFLITQSVFKTKGGGEGFRGLRYERRGQNPTYLSPIKVQDLGTIQAFEGATNRTAVFIAGKSAYPVKYPVPYVIWTKHARKSITQDTSLKVVLLRTDQTKQVAEPVDANNNRSPWITGSPKVIHLLKELRGRTSEYASRKGVYCPTNAIYWLAETRATSSSSLVVTNLADTGKTRVREVTTGVEPEFVHPLIRGKEVKRWAWTSKLSIILPQDPEQPSKAVMEKVLKTKFPKTFRYFKSFESEIRKCALLAQFFDPAKDPFYSSYNVGSYTFCPYKVVWKEIASEIEAAVIIDEECPMIPDHKLVLVACASADDAYFLSGILNSSLIGLFVRSYAMQTSISGHIFDYVTIPSFNSESAAHGRIVELARACHLATRSLDEATLKVLEEELDQVVTAELGLPKDEVSEVRAELTRIRGW